MKNVGEFYEKYCNDYKNDFDNDDKLSEAKKKKFEYKQFQLFDKTDQKLKLNEKAETFFKRLKIALLIKRGL